MARALRAVGRRAHVRLEKHIPVGGGLGGGSSDAAAVLRWAGVDDLAVAAGLGADVPFCVRGGRARVTGIGEVLDPLPFVARTFTLVVPPFGCSTPAVYHQWDALGGPTAAGPTTSNPRRWSSSPGWSSGETGWGRPPARRRSWPGRGRPGSSPASTPARAGSSSIPCL